MPLDYSSEAPSSSFNVSTMSTNDHQIVNCKERLQNCSETGHHPPNTSKRPIYVAATHQHVGKTTTCLALISGLQKRFPQSIGYLKPVGQQHVPVYSKSAGCNIRVDKDVTLIREHFKLKHLDYRYMSPVIIPPGYTRDYIDGKICRNTQLETIKNAYDQIANENEVVLCEGTGHCAVGSIVGASNAKVANMLGADMILIANGGLGSCFDELELNRALCQEHNVKVKGVIVNKVLPEKYDQTRDYISRALMQAWGIPLVGCVPDRPFLGCPALADLERLFQKKMISGSKHRFRHYTVQDINLVTTSLQQFLTNLREKPSRTLYLCHATRDDIIVGFLGEYDRRKRQQAIDGTAPSFEAALVICGREEKYKLSKDMMEMLQGLDDDVPVLIAPHTSHHTMEMIYNFTPKLNVHDTTRVNAAVNHYERYIDYDLLLKQTGNPIQSLQKNKLLTFAR
eukprot:CAMPEP_0197824654 /NCGR_PEP_ID=MMETSP1437-20131217/1879_1 /TAXON_ID=49252 ORGANISM="Eucampia antarctica, Strain CCMP1452" /NCGR_SAMPLE_ID=MMETSP1437 /ASSEMBLY_ACC=CAM_ASM_001096 /LENGTH=453 /DNA_ID=CAMNT_0043424373 /DNA_START=235 /DNA_END=1596 /DNA_ORIENTATION=-